MKTLCTKKLATGNSITFFLLLLGSISPDNRSDAYLFEAEKRKPIQFRCQEYKLPDPNADTVASKHLKAGIVERQRCVRRILPDGNCLFRSISYFVHDHDESRFANVREKIVDHVVNNWSEFTNFIVGVDVYGPTIAIDSASAYKQYMGRDRVWGGHIELEAATRVYKICLHVFYDIKDVDKFHEMGEENERIFALYYWGNGLYGHYSVVEDILVLKPFTTGRLKPPAQTKELISGRIAKRKYRGGRSRGGTRRERRIPIDISA